MNTGCHLYEGVRSSKTPDGWRRLFQECGQCRGPKTLCSITLMVPDNPLKIWLCPPCQQRQHEEVKRALATCLFCGEEHPSTTCKSGMLLVKASLESRKNHGG